MSRNILISITFTMLVASSAIATDLTTIDRNVSRYLVNLGKTNGQTVSGSTPTGIHEYVSGPGDEEYWWKINDGSAVATSNTYGATGSDWVGYRFKFPVKLSKVLLADSVDAYGGTFVYLPTMYVLYGTALQSEAVSCSPPYDPSFNVGVHEYTITPINELSPSTASI